MLPKKNQKLSAKNCCEDLKEPWFSLCQHFHAHGDVNNIYADLSACYCRSDRFYHNLFHIKFCLDEFRVLEPFSKDPYAIELAIWFHDAVYDTTGRNNKEKSAKYFLDVMKNLGVKKDLLKVINLILATRHNFLPVDTDAQIMTDVDLAILGQPFEKFGEYDDQIRKEYSWVSDEDYKVGRSSVLEGFLSRPRIYSTPLFFEKYEAQARQNLVNALSKYAQ